MKKRNYINEEPVYQYTDGSGVPFACHIKAENTSLHIIERQQGRWTYDGRGGNQIIFTIKFEDTGLSCTTKARDSRFVNNENFYVSYALDLMEDKTYEEYYKAALLITKNNIKENINGFEKAQKQFKKTGSWPYPFYMDLPMYKRSYKLDVKTYNSIDIVEEDLKYIRNYK